MQSECTLIGEAGNLIDDYAMLFDLVAGERPCLRAVRVKIRTVRSEQGIGELGQKAALPLIERSTGLGRHQVSRDNALQDRNLCLHIGRDG